MLSFYSTLWVRGVVICSSYRHYPAGSIPAVLHIRPEEGGDSS